MNEELLKEFCESCVTFCDEHKIGLYMVLSHDEGLVHLNKFPEWSVIQHVDEKDSIQLVRDEEESPELWFNRVNKTIAYLDSLSIDSGDVSALTCNLKDSLVTVLTEVFKLEEPTPPTIH